MRFWRRQRAGRTDVLLDGDVLWAGWTEAAGKGPPKTIHRRFDRSSRDDEEAQIDMRAANLTNCRLILPGHEVFSYVIEVPSTDPAEIEQIMQYEIKRRVPVDEPDLVHASRIVGSDSEQYSTVLLAAVPERVVETYIEKLESGSAARAREISPSFVCLWQNHLNAYPPDEADRCRIVLDVNGTFMDLLLLHGERLAFQRSVALAGAQPDADSPVGAARVEFERSSRYLQENGFPSPTELFVSGSNATAFLDGYNGPVPPTPDAAARAQDDDRPAPGCLVARAGSGSQFAKADLSLLPARIRHRQRAVKQIRDFGVLLVAALALLGLVVAVNDILFWKEQQYLDFVNSSIEALGSQAEELSAMMDQIEQSQREVLAQQRFMAAMAEITALAPMDVGIDYVSFEGRQLARVGGQAESRAALFEFMTRLEAVERIADVRAVSMPLREMSNAEVVDYRLELGLLEDR